VTLSATSDQLRVSRVIAALIVLLIYFVREHSYLSTGRFGAGRKSGHIYYRRVTGLNEAGLVLLSKLTLSDKGWEEIPIGQLLRLYGNCRSYGFRTYSCANDHLSLGNTQMTGIIANQLFRQLLRILDL
jgi:hypothetical protein